jgi:C-5 cytosine-specific DNA methylase
VSRPLAIDLFCGLGGWAEGFLAEGYDVVGFDVERHDYGTGGYPGQLVIQDVLTLHGSQLKHAAVIVASPPCQAYSYRAMPWKRAKALPPPSNELFDACFRIQAEACEAAGRYIPLVVENVKGAQPWVGRAAWHYGSFYLWGDVPALMPLVANELKGFGGTWFHNKELGTSNPNRNRCATKNSGGSWFSIAHNTASGHGKNPVNRRNDPRDAGDSVKLGGSWFHDYRKGQGPRNHGSGSTKRKAASAQIAKIPFPLAQHIARCYKPDSQERVA